MATLSENITRAIQDLDSIRDAIINTGIPMPETENVDNYADWIAMMKPDFKLEINMSSTEIPPEGGSVTITITSNTDWVIQYAPTTTQFVFSATSGRGDAVVTVTALANHDKDIAIVGSVSCPHDGSLIKPIGIFQEKFIETLSVSPTSVTLRNMIGDSADVRVTSNTRWNAIVSGPFNIDKNNGTGNGYITISAAAGNDANGTLTITTQYQHVEATVSITQRQ